MVAGAGPAENDEEEAPALSLLRLLEKEKTFLFRARFSIVFGICLDSLKQVEKDMVERLSIFKDVSSGIL